MIQPIFNRKSWDSLKINFTQNLLKVISLENRRLSNSSSQWLNDQLISVSGIFVKLFMVTKLIDKLPSWTYHQEMAVFSRIRESEIRASWGEGFVHHDLKQIFIMTCSGDVLVFSGVYVQGFQRDFRYWNQALMVPRSVQPTKAAFEVTSHKSWQQSWSMSRKVDFFASPKQVAIPDKQKPFKDRYEPSNLFTHWRNHLSWCSFSRCLECFWYVLPVLT